MSKNELPKAYEPQQVEDGLYQEWEASGLFNPDNLPGDRSDAFTISMPPPNATGTLHMGHAVMLAVEDAIIRYQRLQGKKTLWLPGTDHAAIATQQKVERLLREGEGKSKHDLGRDAFLRRVDEFVKNSQDTIRNQVRKMGSSCDWSRERFTLDAGLSQAVQGAFIRMYNDGLIYRGDRIVNWDPELQTTVSDDEVEYIEAADPFYYFQYGPFEIGTARPETKFGDKYVVMHPDDERYAQYQHGQQIELEWINGPITATIIKDAAVDMEFGTGVMTITPWHDATDFDIAERHSLDKQQIIDYDGQLLECAQEFAGMPIAEARPLIVEKLQKKGLVTRVEEGYRHNVAINSRGGGKIEPQIKEQWFVAVNTPVDSFGGKTIKERALEVVRDGSIEIIPKRFEKIYFHWLENLRDWCISRQIWYGHRIPAWHKSGTKEMYVGHEKPEGNGWEQDPDTLDTWFSSGLWTFSTLGWPDKTKDLETFHPTNVLETGYDILFFWIARMIIMSTYFMGEIPFKHVYLHGLVRDEQGRKMSKSLDNIIDPLDMIKLYGADATRLSLVIGTTPGNDTNLSETKIAGYRNFVNKLWNIARYVLSSVDDVRLVTEQPEPRTAADRWILSELNELITFATDNLERYNLSAVGERVYEFTWSKLADWYIEAAKIEGDKDDILLYVLQTILKLWHPFCPYVTERLWKEFDTDGLLMVAEWPVAQSVNNSDQSFALVQEAVTAIRNARSEANIAPSHKPNAIIKTTESELFESNQALIAGLARLGSLVIDADAEKPEHSLTVILSNAEIYIPLAGVIDIAAEQKRLQKELDNLTSYAASLEKKLSNEQFTANAPEEVVATEQQKLTDAQTKVAKITEQLSQLS